jgi:prohibitin 2
MVTINQSGGLKDWLRGFGFFKWVIAIFVVLFIVLPLLNPFVVINAGNRGVITTFGKVDPNVLGEGLHIRIPIMQQVHEINVQIQKGEGEGDSASKDLQSVHT